MSFVKSKPRTYSNSAASLSEPGMKPCNAGAKQGKIPEANSRLCYVATDWLKERTCFVSIG